MIYSPNCYEVTTGHINSLLSGQGRAVYKPIAFRYNHFHTIYTCSHLHILHSAVADIMYLSNLSNHIATGYNEYKYNLYIYKS